MNFYKRTNTFLPLLFVVTIMFFVFPSNAYAYLDPGAGSLVLQLLIAGTLGALFTVKKFFYNIKAFTNRILRGSTLKPKDN